MSYEYGNSKVLGGQRIDFQGKMTIPRLLYIVGGLQVTRWKAESCRKGEKFKRDTVTLEESKQIPDMLDITFEQSFIFSDRNKIKANNKEVMSSIDIVDLIMKLLTIYKKHKECDTRGKCETKINQNVQKKTNLKTSLNSLEKIE